MPSPVVTTGFHSEVRDIIDSRLDGLKEWLDWRLQQQEDLLRSLGASQGNRPVYIQKSADSVQDVVDILDTGFVQDAAHTVDEESQPKNKFSPHSLEFLAQPSSERIIQSEEVEITSSDKCEGQIIGASRSIMAPSSERTKDQIWLSSLMELFDQLDLDRTGSIDLSEFREAVKEVGMEEVHALPVFDALDTSRNGVIDRVEWLQVISDSYRAKDGDLVLVREFLSKIAQLQLEQGHLYKTDHSKRLYCILRHDSILRTVWDVIIIFLLFYVSLTVPYMIGFGESKLLTILDRISDIIFCSDVLLNFRTTFLDSDQTVVVSSKRIAMRYLKTWFAVDLLSSIPMDLISAGFLPDLTAARLAKVGKVAKVLKLLRISRLVVIMHEAEWLDRLDHYLSGGSFEKCWRVVRLTSIACFVTHLLACVGVGVDSESVSFYLSSTVQMDDPSKLQQYIAGFYWAMTTLSTVGYGDITPKSDGGRIFTVMVMVLGGWLYGYVIGSITSIVQDMDVQAHSYYDRVSRIQSWLDRHAEIPLVLRRRLRRHFKKALSSKSVFDDGAVVDKLSPELRSEVASFLIHFQVRRHQMFKNMPKSALAELVHVLQVINVTINERIVKIGDPGLGMYILVHGIGRYDQGVRWRPNKSPTLSIKPTRVFDTEEFQYIVEGDGFGEEIILGLLETYTYTITTLTDSEFHWISEDSFREHFQNLPELHRQMYDAIVHPDAVTRTEAKHLLNSQDEKADSDVKLRDSAAEGAHGQVYTYVM